MSGALAVETRELRPWRELIAPHPDVASGRYRQAEFAADLHQVWRNEAAPEYGDPGELFRRTFLTAGLRALLRNAVRRWRREGGEPVVALQSGFGGGKTHSMIALLHLAAGHSPAPPTGEDGDTALAATTAVLAGQMIPPGRVTTKPDGTRVHTLWGELAWQLGRAEGYRLVADADRSRTSPGAALVALLRRHAPCLVLVDEWVAYARQLYGAHGLPAGSFDAQLTFAQALAEATRAVEGALLVMSVPASDTEAWSRRGGRRRPRRASRSSAAACSRTSPPPTPPSATPSSGRSRSSTAATRRRSLAAARRPTTSAASAPPTRSTRSCSTACTGSGPRSTSSRAPAACSVSWPRSSTSCGRATTPARSSCPQTSRSTPRPSPGS